VYRTIKPGDVRNIKGTEFVMYEHFSKTLKTAKLNDPSPVKLNRMGYQLFYVVPIQNGFAALGLTEKYNVPATILKETWNKNNVAITLYEGGSFKAYSAKRA
jgi:raffinose synthase